MAKKKKEDTENGYQYWWYLESQKMFDKVKEDLALAGVIFRND